MVGGLVLVGRRGEGIGGGNTEVPLAKVVESGEVLSQQVLGDFEQKGGFWLQAIIINRVEEYFTQLLSLRVLCLSSAMKSTLDSPRGFQSLSGTQPFQNSKDLPSQAHLLSFIESAFDQLQGPHHFWLNRVDQSKDFLKKDGTFLVVAGRFFEKEGCNQVVIFETMKLLQQRFPSLHVIGFQDCSSICSADDRSQLIQVIMEEYVTFPIYCQTRNFPWYSFEMKLTDEACFILSKDFKNPLVFHEKDLDVALLNKVIEDLSVQYQVSNIELHSLKGSLSKEAEIYKEPLFCNALQNLLLYYPACISADESGKRLFLSDSNHHRIIIFDGDGKILDCVSFEDGELESAKMLRSAASFYHAAEDCLYIVDS
ncbi:hypothetical protein PTKIN_Ptkin12aG0100600 [Pterospermum kingtungense]